jgi:outer membrane protein TolC
MYSTNSHPENEKTRNTLNMLLHLSTNKTVRIISVSLFYILFLYASIFALTDSLTIEQAIRLALDNHPSLVQAQQAITSAEAHTNSLHSLLLPTLGATASYANIGPDEPMNIFNREVRLFPVNNYDGHITVEYMAYDFGKRQKIIQGSQITQELATDRLEDVKQSLAFQASLLFNSIIILQQAIPVKDEEIDALKRHLEIVKKKVETGSATEFDILKTEVLLENSNSQRLELTNELNKKQIALKQLLCLKPETELNLKNKPVSLEKNINTDSLISLAIQTRAEHKLAVHSKLAAQLQKESVLLENRPTLGFRGTAGVKNGLMPDIEKPSLNWNAGAQVSIPIYDGNKRQEHLLESECNLKAASAGISVIESQITTEILQAVADIDASIAKLELSEKQVTLSEKSLHQAQLQYEAGTIINNDVLDAETEYSRAKLMYLQNQQRYSMNCYNLTLLTGIIPRVQDSN